MAAAKGNKYGLGNDGGRPAMFETPEQAQKKIEKYFETIKGKFHMETHPETQLEFRVWDIEPEPATITGLALFLGFESRQSLYDYEKKEGFTCIIKKARLRVEHEYEKKLNYDKCTGAVFALKNMGWSDRMDLQQTSTNINYEAANLTKEEIKEISKGLDEKY